MSKEDETFEPSVPLMEPDPPGTIQKTHTGIDSSAGISENVEGDGKPEEWEGRKEGGYREIGDEEVQEGQEEKKKRGTLCLLLICCLAVIILLAIISIPSYFIYEHFFKSETATAYVGTTVYISLANIDWAQEHFDELLSSSDDILLDIDIFRPANKTIITKNTSVRSNVDTIIEYSTDSDYGGLFDIIQDSEVELEGVIIRPYEDLEETFKRKIKGLKNKDFNIVVPLNIYKGCKLKLNSVNFTGNVNHDENGVGVIYIDEATVEIHSAGIHDNGGNLASFIYAAGGSVVKITDSLFKNNPPSKEFSGNPIFLENESVLEVTGSDFNEHTSLSARGIIYLENSNATIEKSNFKNNECESAGTAISLYNSNGIINDSNFDGNSAKRSAGALLLSESKVEINNCKFLNNKIAEKDGGAIKTMASNVAIKNSIFSNNIAYDDGGAIHFSNISRGTVSNTIFEYNTVFKDQGLGAAIILSEASRLIVEFSDFSYNLCNGSIGSGAAYYLRGLSSLTVTDTTFNHNFAYGYGGAGYADGSVIVNEGNTYTNNSVWGCGGAIRLQRASALYDESSSYIENKSNGEGGAICVSSDSRADIDDTVIFENNVSARGSNDTYYE